MRTLKAGLVHTFQVAERSMEQAMLGVSVMDPIRNKYTLRISE